MDQSIPDDKLVKTLNWYNVPGGLKHAAVDVNGEIWGVNSIDGIWTREHVLESDWVNVPGGLKNIDIRRGVVWGVNSGDAIYVKDNS